MPITYDTLEHSAIQEDHFCHVCGSHVDYFDTADCMKCGNIICENCLTLDEMCSKCTEIYNPKDQNNV